jgi:hypothetical protein
MTFLLASLLNSLTIIVQYSRKNNIKVFNMKKRDKQNLREDFIDLVKKDLNVDLELRDVVAIHRLPSDRPGEKPIIVRLFNSDAKRNVMRGILFIVVTLYGSVFGQYNIPIKSCLYISK